MRLGHWNAFYDENANICTTLIELPFFSLDSLIKSQSQLIIDLYQFESRFVGVKATFSKNQP